MNCCFARELVSADLDGELVEDERRLLTQHLGRCADCRRYAARATDLHRSVRVQAAPPVPDLTPVVLARLGDAGPARAGTPRLLWRAGLAAVGLAQVVLTLPALVRHPDATTEMHAVHHLNAWTVAFAVGLLVVAWQPWRVRGVLPIATALAAVMVFTVALDLRNNHTIGMPVTAHVLELAGLVLAWGLARHERAGGDPMDGDHGRRRPAWWPMGTDGTAPAWLRPGGGPGAWARAEDTERAA